MQPGTYLLYSTNLEALSNGAEDFGGMMTEIVIIPPVMAGRLAEMTKHSRITATLAAAPLLVALAAPVARADIPGVTDQAGGTPGAQFDLWARSGTVVLGDGNSLRAWGYSVNAASGHAVSGAVAHRQ